MPEITIVKKLCDYCWSEEERKEVEATRTIRINGREAFACDPHGQPVQETLDEFNEVSRSVGQGGRPARPARGRSKPPTPPAGPEGEPETAVVRAWAKAENEKAGEIVYPVSEKARVRQKVVDAYKAAHA